MNNATVENRKIELLNGGTFAISHEKRAQMRKSAIVKESPFPRAIGLGSLIDRLTSARTLVFKSHLFGVAEQYMASTDMWNACDVQ